MSNLKSNPEYIEYKGKYHEVPKGHTKDEFLDFLMNVYGAFILRDLLGEEAFQAELKKHLILEPRFDKWIKIIRHS